jgi:hypothetical protein
MSLAQRIAGMLGRAKDAGSSFAAERMLQGKIERYGRMLNLSIDSKLKTIHIEVQLKGEKDPTTIIIHEYAIITEGSQTSILVKKAASSKEWMDLLIRDFVEDRKFPIPQNYANTLKIVL